ncbi:MAG: OmpH family outer membrane protein [Nitrospirota bacterium]
MKKIVKNFLLPGLLLAALCMMPVSARAVDAVKLGAVDVQKVLNESEAGKKAKTDLEALIKSKQTVIDEKGKTVEKFKSDIEKQASVLSAEARKTKEEELEKAVREYQRLVQDSQADVKKREAELTENILREIQELIQKVGEEEGYVMIFERGMVIHSSKGIDLTETILKKYDEMKSKSKK